jgi:hypothetical protein
VSLSDNRVIQLLNQYFVPVYLSNEDYSERGAASAEEKAELQRIRREGLAKGLSVGTVHAYVLTPDGHPADSLHVVDAAKADRMVGMLQRTVEKLALKPGPPLVSPAPPAVPAAEPGTLRLHVTSRYLERRGNAYVLVENAGGNWSALPGEDWLRLSGEQQAKLLPGRSVTVGQTWTLDPDVSATLLHRFYPPTENNDLGKNRMEEQSLTGTVTVVSGGVAKARITGSLRMKHPFYHKEDGNDVRATLAGTLEWEPASGRIRTLRLVTDEATYGAGGNRQPFGVALRSLP